MPIVKANRAGNINAFQTFGTRESLPISASVVGWNKGINMGSPTSNDGTDSLGVRNLMYGVSQSTTEGYLNGPCLQLLPNATWRFRLVVKPGQRRLAIWTKQADLNMSERPTIRIKSNAAVGIPSDLVATAPNGNDWVLIGPIIFTATGTDMVWVEVENNLQIDNTPAYFDRIVFT